MRCGHEANFVCCRCKSDAGLELGGRAQSCGVHSQVTSLCDKDLLGTKDTQGESCGSSMPLEVRTVRETG
jgi:hypothetical protein